MKRRNHRSQWSKGYLRPHKRGRAVVYPLYPLPRTVSARHDGDDGALQPILQPDEPQESERQALSHPRGVRIVAWLLLASIPLAGMIWALSIVVPIVWETQQASGKVFVEPVVRERFATAVVNTPVVPASIDTPVPMTATVGPTATTPPTPVAGEPTWTPSPEPAITPTPYPAWDGNQPVNILLLGVDSRVGEESPPRSDTIIIVRVDPIAKRVDILSVPRDLLVEIPGYYATKVNAAYPFGEVSKSIPGGGPTLVAQTIEYNFGIPIDYFALIDIAGMEAVIDILGGIVVDVQSIIKDEQYPTENYGYTRVYFTPGLQLMDGERAVRFSRTRHDDGDFARQDRQQQVLLAIRDRALATGVISKLPQIISEVGDSVRTDLSRGQVLSLARLAQDIHRENIYQHSLTRYVHEETINDGFYFVADWEAVRALAADLPGDPYATSGLETNPSDNPDLAE